MQMYPDDASGFEQYANDDWTIWDELSHAVIWWQYIHATFWASGAEGELLTPEEQSRRQAQGQIAEIVLKLIKSMSVGGAVEQGSQISLNSDQLKTLRALFRDFKKDRIVVDLIGLNLAQSFTQQLLGSTDRAFKLLAVLHGSQLSERCAGYLARVSAVYLQGLEVETAIFCRSALESALIERLGEELNSDDQEPSIEQLLRMAGERGVLPGYEKIKNPRGWRTWRPRTGSVLDMAHQIRRAGNFVVHTGPRYPDDEGAIKNAFEAIRLLSIVLATLFPGEKAT